MSASLDITIVAPAGFAGDPAAVDRAEALRSVQTRLRLAVDVADLLGISPTTLRRLRERDPDNFGPSFAMWFRGIQL